MRNEIRIGNFTSSEIGAIMSNGKANGALGAPALTYINECNMERRLGRHLDNEASARPTSWGNLCERQVSSMLPLEYSAVSKETLLHPSFDYWAGSPDTIIYQADTRAVGDIKCPFTLKSFCTLVDAWHKGGIKAIRESHKDGEKYFWQLVSNACITGCAHAELIVYAPYKSELAAIRALTETAEYKNDVYSWMTYADDNALPWLPDGGFYKNLNKFRFEISKEDKEALTKRVEFCGSMLVQPVLISA